VVLQPSCQDKHYKSPQQGYDQQKVLALWVAGKSIAEIAEAMKPISRVYIHRVLTAKIPNEYEAGQKTRKATRAKAAE
jgi:hypothetical protein